MVKANHIVHLQPHREWEDVQVKIKRLETLDFNAILGFIVRKRHT